MSEHYDLVVVGAGPGGATVATFVAMQGYRVLLLEKETLPIHKIGESLLPSTVNGICAMLGVTDDLARANFVRKYGGTFIWGKSKEPWTFAFSMSSKIAGPTSFAYQVERMKFDQILVDNARRNGVEVREGHAVMHALSDDTGRITGLAYRDADGQAREVRARFVVDASGWTTPLAREVGTRIYSQFFRNVAVYGYFQNGGRLPPPLSGNILSVAFDKGWFWYIPLSDTLTSVGAVMGQEYAHLLKPSPEQAFAGVIDTCEPIRKLLANATRVTSGPYGEVRIRKDYSYVHSAFWKPGLSLIGDAACFVDPVFSSGVHLATYAALLVARSICTCLKGTLSEEQAFGEFERRYRREYRYFYEFLVSFYNVDQDVDSYYWAARKVLSSAEVGNEAFIQLVAGIAGSGERLFENREAFLRHQASLSEGLFAVDRDRAAVDPAKNRFFLAGLLAEATQLQTQAMLEDARAPEQALFDGGLVPSPDGFHWIEAGAAISAVP